MGLSWPLGILFTMRTLAMVKAAEMKFLKPELSLISRLMDGYLGRFKTLLVQDGFKIRWLNVATLMKRDRGTLPQAQH